MSEICGNCGTKNNKSANYCSKCGADLTKKKSKQKEQIILWIGTIISLIIVSVICSKMNESDNSQSKETLYCKVIKANVRNIPSKSGNIINSLSLNEEVVVLGDSSTWYKIKKNDLVGWVSKNLLSPTKISVEAKVWYVGETFYITNLNNIDWENVVFKLNYTMTDAFKVRRSRVGAGSTITISCYEFVNDNSERFNILRKLQPE